jgi:hypothetical protein
MRLQARQMLCAVTLLSIRCIVCIFQAVLLLISAWGEQLKRAVRLAEGDKKYYFSNGPTIHLGECILVSAAKVKYLI